MEVGKVIYPGIDADTHAWRDLRATLARRGVPMDTGSRGQSLYAGDGIAMTVLSPERAGQYEDRNDNSVVTLLHIHGQRFLFTGDMGPQAEADLLAKGDGRLRGAILKVPHHGSDLSNAQAFLQAVHPTIAVLSAGRCNRFGHPGPVTVDALEALGSRLYLTARDGAVTFACDRGGADWAQYLPPRSDTSGHHGIDAARGPDRKKGRKRKNVH